MTEFTAVRSMVGKREPVSKVSVEKAREVNVEQIQAAQHEVQRSLGRCLLRLQQYEALMKAMLATHDIGGTVSTLESAVARRTAEFATTNLGELAKRLFKAVVVSDDFDEDDAEHTASGSPTEIAFRTVVRIQMARADYETAKQGVKDLVDLRNTLVHHFLALFDVWTVKGCTDATEYLSHAYTRIDEHCGTLRQWAQSLDNAKQAAAREMATPEFTNLLVNGITPDGQVLWPASGLVSCLREAARTQSVDGWTPLETAVRLAALHHPSQTPQRYGCRSWPHALHESRLFDLRYTRDADAAKVAWYRERAQ